MLSYYQSFYPIDALPTPPTFHEAAVRSGLVDAARLARAIEIAGSDNVDAVATVLIKHGVLTVYQANQLREGRTKLTLGPYLITDFIGQGGMGRVFKAVHQVMGRQCAVKVLPREKSTSESRDSFRREIRVQAGLDSPYVVRAFDAGQDGKVHYLVTEYVPGTDLRQLVRSRGPLPMDEAAMILSQAAMGLQYAHDLGLIHRDIKPGNILVTPDGHAKLSDIGLAAWSMGLADDPRAGKIVGTADYLSPEQVRDPMSVGPLSDIYGLGCTLYYAVTGKVPFPGGDARSKCRRHCEETPWHPRNLARELSEEFVDVIGDMMEKDPSRRIQSAAEVAERLEPWASAARPLTHDPAETSPSRQVWTPPPPPHEPSQIRELPEPPQTSGSGFLNDQALHDHPLQDDLSPGTGSLGTGSLGTGSLGTGSHGYESEPSLGGFSSGIGSEPAMRPRPSHGLAIAITLAIAVPISLMIGAIIGFLFHGMM